MEPLEKLRRKAPNIAVLLFLIQPIIAIVILGLGATGGLRPGALPAVIVSGALSVAAAGLIAARVRNAPLYATGVVIVTVIVCSIIVRFCEMSVYREYGPGGGPHLSSINFVVFQLFALAAAWFRRDTYTHELEPDKLPGWAWAGFRNLVREDRTAMTRLVFGLAATVIATILIFLPLVLRIDPQKFLVIWVLRIFRIILIGGPLTIISALRIPDEKED